MKFLRTLTNGAKQFFVDLMPNHYNVNGDIGYVMVLCFVSVFVMISGIDILRYFDSIPAFKLIADVIGYSIVGILCLVAISKIVFCIRDLISHKELFK